MKLPYQRYVFYTDLMDQLIHHTETITKIFLGPDHVLINDMIWMKQECRNDPNTYFIWWKTSDKSFDIECLLCENDMFIGIGYLIDIEECDIHDKIYNNRELSWIDGYLRYLIQKTNKDMPKMLKNYPAVDLEELCAEAFKPDRIARRVAEYDDYMEHFYS